MTLTIVFLLHAQALSVVFLLRNLVSASPILPVVRHPHAAPAAPPPSSHSAIPSPAAGPQPPPRPYMAGELLRHLTTQTLTSTHPVVTTAYSKPPPGAAATVPPRHRSHSPRLRHRRRPRRYPLGLTPRRDPLTLGLVPIGHIREEKELR
jgi:hypothetical protein